MVDDLGQTPLHKAARYGHQSCVEFLLRKAPHTARYVDKYGHTAMAVAAFSKHIECMELLLQREMQVPGWTDKEGRTPLHWAACAGHSTLVRDLLKTIPVETTDASGKTALHWAISGSNEEAVRVLLEHGASITFVCKEDKCNAIHYAAMNGNLTILQMMFGARNVSEVNSTNERGSPLSFAALRGHSECVGFLLDRGADVSFVAPGGNTILHCAIRGGCSEELVQRLISAGQREDALNDAEETPTHYAACIENTNILEKLLTSHGRARAVAATKSGNTPLHYAANYGNVGAMKSLLGHKADPQKANQKGSTPVSIAERRNFTRCVECMTEQSS